MRQDALSQISDVSVVGNMFVTAPVKRRRRGGAETTELVLLGAKSWPPRFVRMSCCVLECVCVSVLLLLLLLRLCCKEGFVAALRTAKETSLELQCV